MSSPSMTSARVALVVWAMLASAGCLPDFGAEYCVSHSDCPNGQFCLASACVAGAPDAAVPVERDAEPAPDTSVDAGPMLPDTGLGHEWPVEGILFPPASSLTDDVRAMIVGTATASSPIAIVRVNGIPATSTDGFRTWRAEIPLRASTTTVSVDVVPTIGDARVGVLTTTIQRAPLIGRPSGIAVDPEHRAIYVLDEARDDVWRIDAETGEAVVIFSEAGRSPPAKLAAITFDRASSTLVVAEHLERGREQLVAMGPSRAGVWSPADAMPALEDVRAMTMGEGDRLYVLTATSVVTVTRWTGERATDLDFADLAFGTGVGEPISDPVSIDWDPVLGEFVIFDRRSSMLVGVDPDTRVARALWTVDLDHAFSRAATLDVSAHLAYFAGLNRSLRVHDLVRNSSGLVSKEAVRGVGPPLGVLAGLAFDDLGARVFGTDPTRSGIVAVDVATGDRRLVVSADTPPVRVIRPSAIERGPRDVEMFLADDPQDPQLQRLWCVGGLIASRSRTVGFDSIVAHGRAMLPLDEYSALVLDNGFGALFSLGCQDAPKLVSGNVPGMNSVGTGENIVQNLIVGDPSLGRVKLLDARTWLDIDLATGDRVEHSCHWPEGTTLVDAELFHGDIWAIASSTTSSVLAVVEEHCRERPAIADALPGLGTALAIDPEARRIYVAVSKAGRAGEIWVRTIGEAGFVQVPPDGPGPRLLDVTGLVWDATRSILWATDRRLDAVIAIEPSSGAKAVIFK